MNNDVPYLSSCFNISNIARKYRWIQIHRGRIHRINSNRSIHLGTSPVQILVNKPLFCPFSTKKIQKKQKEKHFHRISLSLCERTEASTILSYRIARKKWRREKINRNSEYICKNQQKQKQQQQNEGKKNQLIPLY